MSFRQAASSSAPLGRPGAAEQNEHPAHTLEPEQASSALIEHTQRQMATILDRVTDGFFALDTEWRFTYLNRETRKLIQRHSLHDPQTVIGATLWEVAPKLVGSRYEGEFRRAMAKQTAVHFEAYHPDLDLWLGFHIYPDPDGLTVYVRDVTERKKIDEAVRTAMAEAEQANTAKSEFLSRMSHELRTPLNAILGFSQLLGFSSLALEDRDSLHQIMKAGHHLLGLINDVLDIVRIDAGRMSLSLEPLLVSEQIYNALELMQPLADQHKLNLRYDLNGADHDYIQADRQRLHQVLLNLLGNAIKYTPAPGTVTVACREEEGGWLHMEVRDTGPGISPANLERLFTPFERLGAETKGIEGTGLGLAHAKRLTEAMRGTIGVHSEVGVGSTFWVAFPLVSGQLEQVGKLADDLPPPQIATANSTLLYIEDNPSNTQLIERIIARRSGIVLHTVTHGELGLDLARVHQPDLILLDLHLPDIPGWEVLARLRSDPTTEKIPIVILSADATPRQIERLLAAGANAYLTKPLDIRQFIAVLDETLGGKPA